MRQETITRELFNFAELSDDAKEKARAWYRDGNLDYDWWDSAYDDFDQIGEILGIRVDDKYFSGFWSQGDGASWFGAYSYQKGAAKRIRDYAPSDVELHRIADGLQALQSRFFYQLSASVSRSYGGGNYVHSGVMSVDVEHFRHGGEIDDSVIEEIREFMRDLANWLYAALECEYDHLQSDECVDESIDANEYEFTESGAIA